MQRTVQHPKPPVGEPTNERVRALLAAVPDGGDLLDIGCVQHEAGNAGNRNWLHGYLYERADDVLGVDILTEAVENLRKQGYSVRVADAEQLALDREFDTIVAGELIEHLSNPGAFLDSVKDHLRDDGVFLLTTPNPWAFHRFKQALLADDVNANPEHTCWFDERTLRQLFTRHGFATEIDYVRPTTRGITSLLYRLGYDCLGGTSLLLRATNADIRY